MDTGQGRLANIDDEEWDEWSKEMRMKGVILNELPLNATSVLAITDELF